MEQLAEMLRASPPSTNLQLTFMYRGDVEARLSNLRTLCEELEDVLSQSVRYGCGVSTRGLLDRLRFAEGALAHAVAVAAEDAGLSAEG